MSFQDIALFLNWLGDVFFAGFVISATIYLTIAIEDAIKKL
jgi:hypothetical protein